MTEAKLAFALRFLLVVLLNAVAICAIATGTLLGTWRCGRREDDVGTKRERVCTRRAGFPLELFVCSGGPPWTRPFILQNIK